MVSTIQTSELNFRDGSRVILNALVCVSSKDTRAKLWYGCDATVWDLLDSSWNKEPHHGTENSVRFVLRNELHGILFIIGSVRSCLRFLLFLDNKASYCLVMFCASNSRFCFWSFCNESTFEAWIPLRFPGKKHTRQEMVLYRFLLNKRMCRYQIIVFISVLCVSKLTIIDMFHLSLLTNRLIFFKKDVEIATWLILPVAYACLKD